MSRDFATKNSFYSELYEFHRTKRTPIVYWPTLNGREVNLLELHKSITKLGGYEKVNKNDAWEDVISDLDCEKLDLQTCHSDYLLRFIYARYLEPYVRHHLHPNGETEAPDQFESDEERSFHPSAKRRATHVQLGVVDVPLTYNLHNHKPSERMREYFDMPSVCHPNPYDNLLKSILSGLPNEVDAALSAMCHLSSRAQLNLSGLPALLDTLCCLCGVLDDSDTMLELYTVWCRGSCLWNAYQPLYVDLEEEVTSESPVPSPEAGDHESPVPSPEAGENESPLQSPAAEASRGDDLTSDPAMEVLPETGVLPAVESDGFDVGDGDSE